MYLRAKRRNKNPPSPFFCHSRRVEGGIANARREISPPNVLKNKTELYYSLCLRRGLIRLRLLVSFLAVQCHVSSSHADCLDMDMPSMAEPAATPSPSRPSKYSQSQTSVWACLGSNQKRPSSAQSPSVRCACSPSHTAPTPWPSQNP